MAEVLGSSRRQRDHELPSYSRRVVQKNHERNGPMNVVSKSRSQSKEVIKSNQREIAESSQRLFKSSSQYRMYRNGELRPEYVSNLAQGSQHLQPILETRDAQAVHLEHLHLPQVNRAGIVSSRRSSIITPMTPDNGILFLDNKQRLFNPTNQKTPPPPMFGEVLEEDLYDNSQPFYDHDKAVMEGQLRRIQLKDIESKLPAISEDGRKLKRKVIYVYEKDDENDN